MPFEIRSPRARARARLTRVGARAERAFAREQRPRQGGVPLRIRLGVFSFTF